VKFLGETLSLASGKGKDVAQVKALEKNEIL